MTDADIHTAIASTSTSNASRLPPTRAEEPAGGCPERTGDQDTRTTAGPEARGCEYETDQLFTAYQAEYWVNRRKA